MDLLAEGDTGVRILTARHISDKSFQEIDNAINTTLLCHNYSLQPDFASYLAALQKYAVGLWVSGFAILLTICVLHVLTVRTVWRHSRNSAPHAAVVLAVYPVVAAAAYLATIVPRAMLLCEAIAQQAVMIAIYQFFCMVIADCGGADRLVRRAGDCHLETRVLPCCCWPCCFIPRPQMEKRNLLRIRYLVLQLPVIQALIYITILVIWAEDMILYTRSVMFFQPLVAASILTGVWGIMMAVRAAEAGGARPRPRLVALQLALLIVKLQAGLLRALPALARLPCLMPLQPAVFLNREWLQLVSIRRRLPCLMPLQPAVFLNLLQNSVTLVEMLLLSVLAWRLYSAPCTKSVDKVQHAVIATVEDSSLDVKTLEGDVRSYKFKNDM